MVLLAPALVPSAFASVFLIISMPSLFFSVISIIPLIFTSGMGILLLASSIAFFISGESSISWMASRPFLDTARKHHRRNHNFVATYPLFLGPVRLLVRVLT